MPAEKDWSGKTYGSGGMHARLVGTLRYIHPWFLYVFSGVFIVPVCMLVNRSGKLSYRFYRKRFGFSRLKSLRYCWRNHYRFSQTVIDKFAMYAGRRFAIEIKGYEHFSRLAHSEEGFIQLSSHIGCYEIAGYSLVSSDKRFNALVYGGEAESVMINRINQLTPNGMRMILTRPDMGHLFEINEALNNGEIVSLPADRIFGSQKHAVVSLLGAPANIPLGPFATIRSKGCKALVVNVMRKRHSTYRIHVSPLATESEGHSLKPAELASAYAREIERIVRLYPDQWFNFFPYWDDDK